MLLNEKLLFQFLQFWHHKLKQIEIINVYEDFRSISDLLQILTMYSFTLIFRVNGPQIS